WRPRHPEPSTVLAALKGSKLLCQLTLRSAGRHQLRRSGRHWGGIVGGWSLYAHEGRLKYCYNFLGVEHFMVTAEQPIPAGKHQVRMEFAYDGGGLAKGGDVTLY